VKTLIGYGPKESMCLVAVRTDPATLPANSGWYLTTRLPTPEPPRADESPLACASLEQILRLYGLRRLVEQSYKQVEHELGFSDFHVHSDRAIRRRWQLVFCVFSFCWLALVVSVVEGAPAAGAA